MFSLRIKLLILTASSADCSTFTWHLQSPDFGVVQFLQLWPLRVINGNITPISRVIYDYKPIYNC